jgi:hypothetical protein
MSAWEWTLVPLAVAFAVILLDTGINLWERRK